MRLSTNLILRGDSAAAGKLASASGLILWTD